VTVPRCRNARRRDATPRETTPNTTPRGRPPSPHNPEDNLMFRSLPVLALLACAACSNAVASCATDDTTPAAAPAAQQAAVVPAAGQPDAVKIAGPAHAAAGAITGKITFEGTPPAHALSGSPAPAGTGQAARSGAASLQECADFEVRPA